MKQSLSAAGVLGILQLFFLYYIGGYRRNSLWVNPSLTGASPVPAM
ncbi:hypothetical protein [Pectobacterium colocasium]